MSNKAAIYCAAWNAYVRLLSLGQYEGRCTNAGQSELAALRDALAEFADGDPEALQNEAEEDARKLIAERAK